jgi:UDP-GlcNAc:undecaprenyl-phosphate/decaprenyl-phosphate GlcNAc-1-phosphate transferase
MANNLIIYFILSFLLILSCSIISYKLNLLDIPNKRKKHSLPTAYTGGLALSVVYIFSIQILDVVGDELNLILSIGFLMAMIGFIDDKYTLNTGGKLSLQIIPIFFLIVIENISLYQIGDYNYFQLELNSFSTPFTILCVLFLINSFNYFDGLDGTLSFATISVLSILYFLIDNKNSELFLLSILLPICIFLCFNFSLFNLPKMFLGDSGSLLLGFVIAFFLIYLANQKIIHSILIAWSIAIFVYEFLSINLIRLKNKKNIFIAGVDHLHHNLFKKTNSILLTNFLISITNIILFIIGYAAFKFISPLISLILFIFLFIVFFILRNNYFSFKNF